MEGNPPQKSLREVSTQKAWKQQADRTTLKQGSKDDETFCTGSTSSRGSQASTTSSNVQDATTGSLMPHVTLSRGGPLIWVLRQVPLVMLVGGAAVIACFSLWSFTMFSITFLCLNFVIVSNFFCVGFYGLIGTLLTIPAWCNRDWNRESEEVAGFYNIQHYVIIPSYKEDLSVLDATIQAVAESPIARRCIRVVLAMEARDPDASETARQLENKWGGNFLELFSTMHPADLPMEVAGKSSNTAWAFAEVSGRARELRLNPRRTVISVNDADCLWHPNYFQAVSLDVLRLSEDATAWMIWQAPQMQMRNYFNVPVLTKMTGVASALVEVSGLRCSWGLHICFSSYTMLLELADRVGGWDPDVIAEDHHMFSKCYFASVNDNGDQPCSPRLRLQRVFLPVKSFLVESEHGSNTCKDYTASLQARMVQARRHTQGSAEIPYVLLQWVETVRCWGLHKVPFGVHLGAARILWTMLSLHAWSYLHCVSVMVANLYFLRRFYGAEAMNGLIHFPVQACSSLETSGWMHLHCIVFLSIPWLFVAPTIMVCLGHFAVLDLFTSRKAPSELQLQDVECSDGKALLETDKSGQRSQIWYAERGGSAGCPIMRWRVVLMVQIALETLILGPAIVILIGFLPTLCAVWHIAAIGVHFGYRTASKPIGAGVDKS